MLLDSIIQRHILLCDYIEECLSVVIRDWGSSPRLVIPPIWLQIANQLAVLCIVGRSLINRSVACRVRLTTHPSIPPGHVPFQTDVLPGFFDHLICFLLGIFRMEAASFASFTASRSARGVAQLRRRSSSAAALFGFQTQLSSSSDHFAHAPYVRPEPTEWSKHNASAQNTKEAMITVTICMRMFCSALSAATTMSPLSVWRVSPLTINSP